MGAGRSGLVAKAFAMRLMHLGFQAFVVGETITPSLSKGDIMVIFSGSGRTKTVADIAETAKEIGAKICLITSNAEFENWEDFRLHRDYRAPPGRR